MENLLSLKGGVLQIIFFSAAPYRGIVVIQSPTYMDSYPDSIRHAARFQQKNELWSSNVRLEPGNLDSVDKRRWPKRCRM